MVNRILIRLLKLYQRYLSPFTGANCRFHPSCSQYAIDSLRTFGLLRGAMHTVRRLAKCHPCHPGGYDPVGKS